MKTDLDHLPQKYRTELDHMITALQQEFDQDELLKIILFGSFARGTYVDEFHIGPYYQSDYDLLVLVRDTAGEDLDQRLYAVEDRLHKNSDVDRSVQIIGLRLFDMNQYLRKGYYFYKDIYDDGILLFEHLSGKKYQLAEPQEINSADRYELAKEYFETRFPQAQEFLENFRFSFERQKHNMAAFQLHQATEHAYHTFLLTHSLYTPKLHDLSKLRSFAEDMNRDMQNIWLREKPYKRYFEQLRRAYVEARYSKHYQITKEELEWLESRVNNLHKLIEKSCTDKLEELKDKVGTE